MRSFFRLNRFAVFVSVIGIAVAAYSLAVALTVLSSQPQLRVQYIPDDTFYYLTLARNFVRLHTWTFDSGASLTTGFHLLHAYALAALYRLFGPSPDGYVQLASLLTWVVGLGAYVIGLAFVLRTKHPFPAALLFLFALSRNVSLNSISGLEWSWVVCTSALYLVCFFRASTDCAGRWLPALFMIGSLGSLARTDFGLLPASLALTALVTYPMYRRRRVVSVAWVGLGGAVFGLLLVLLHNYMLTGQMLQSSAIMKAYWNEVLRATAAPIIYKSLTIFVQPTTMSLYLALLLCCTALLLCCTALALGIRGYLPGGVWADLRDTPSPRTIVIPIMWLASVISVAGYVFFYISRDASGVQNWYTANIAVPLLLVLSLPVLASDPRNRISHAAQLIAGALLILQIASAGDIFARAEWPHQAAMYRAGTYLREMNIGRTGSWNAGIIGFYQGGHVVNLDGLVNNDIWPYAKSNTLPEYICRQSIDYVADFQSMLESQLLRQRGGYERDDFLARLEPVQHFGGSPGAWQDLTLYRVRKP